MLHGRAAGGAIAIEVNRRPLEFDRGRGIVRLACLEGADDGIRRAVAGNGPVLFQFPVIAALGEPRVAERITEDLAEEVPLKLSLVDGGEPAGGFEIGPVQQYLVCRGEILTVQPEVVG